MGGGYRLKVFQAGSGGLGGGALIVSRLWVQQVTARRSRSTGEPNPTPDKTDLLLLSLFINLIGASVPAWGAMLPRVRGSCPRTTDIHYSSP